jgi:acetyl esterase/lipase
MSKFLLKYNYYRSENISLFTNIAYNTDHNRQSLDIYRSHNSQNAPVLFFVHGGGWTEGDKSMYKNIGLYFSKNGFCTVVINHRQSPEVKHPEHTIDAASAFSWTKKNIEGYGGNPEKISLMGHSSGGHIIALLASNPSYLMHHGHSVKEIHSMVGISGVYSIKLMATLSIYQHVFHTEDHEAASPLSYTPSCPVLLVHGERDYSSMPRQSSHYHDKIIQAGGSCEVYVAEGETHSSIIANACKNEKSYVKKIVDFLHN